MVSLHAMHFFRRDMGNCGVTAGIMRTMIDPVDDVTRPLPVATECPIRLQYASEERTYTVLLMQDLFKQWMIMQAWSGKQNASGGSKPRFVESLEAGVAALGAIARKFEARGMVPLHA
jgi:hypothetical protein